MHRLTFSVRVFRLASAAALVSSLGAAPSAFAQPPPNLTCPGKQVVQRIEEKGCPATPKRPVQIRKRVCCQRPSGQINCHPFHPCQANSPN
ncbi:MAG: hypothetical protein ABIR79_25015 [Candidatus Binatia bacterium]